MAKPDWGELQQRFLSDHAATGVSPKDWCEAQGLNYATARRYIKKPTAQTAQKPAQKKLRTAQKEKCAEELVDDDGLTDQQRLFVAEYLKDNNATQAAIRAGYSKKTANEQGARLLAKLVLRRPLRSSRKHPLCARLEVLMKCLSRCGAWPPSTPTSYHSIAAGVAAIAGASVTSTNGVMLLSTKRSGSKRLSVNVENLWMMADTATTTPAHLTRNALAVMVMASASLSSLIHASWRLMLRLPIPALSSGRMALR